MRGRPAILLFGAGLVACWHDAAPRSTAIDNHAPLAQPSSLAGSYTCTITQQAFRYPEFPCAIRDTGGQLVLAKLAGSVRFEGRVEPREGGFVFSGRVYCPYGDCDEQVTGTFAPTPDGGLRGTLGGDRMVVELHRASGAFAGASYGGASYGGAAYGGASYGGASYGGASYGGASGGGALPPPPPPPPPPP